MAGRLSNFLPISAWTLLGKIRCKILQPSHQPQNLKLYMLKLNSFSSMKLPLLWGLKVIMVDNLILFFFEKANFWTQNLWLVAFGARHLLSHQNNLYKSFSIHQIKNQKNEVRKLRCREVGM